MIHLGDITKIHGDAVPRVTIITGGSPCQDLSVAGKRAGLAGERSGLYMDQIRIVKEMRLKSEQELRDSGADFDVRRIAPRYMVWENVPGALSSGTPKGADFQAVLEEAAKVVDKDAVIPGPPDGKWPSAGCIVSDRWSIAWRVHDAQWWGVAQRRKRICMLCDFNGQSAGEILFECWREAEDSDNLEADEQSGTVPGPEIYAVAEGLPRDSESCGKQGQGSPEGAQGRIDDASYTLKIRGEKDVDRYGRRAGKGALVQTELSGTLGVSQDQTLVEVWNTAIAFEPVAMSRVGGHYSEEVAGTVRQNAGDNQQAVVYGIGSYDSNAMKSDNPASGIYEAETSRTLDLNGGSPACNQGGMAVVQGVDIYNGAVTGDVAASIMAGGMTNAHGSGPRVLVPVDERSKVVAGLREIADFLDESDKATVRRAIEMLICIEGNGARESHREKGYVESETMFTLNTVEQHAVAYRKTGHPMSAEEGQGWQEAEINDTVNAFDNSESRTPILVLENHPADSRVKIADDGIVQTLSSRMGTGGGYVPMVAGSYQETTGSLCASGYDKLGIQEAMNDMYVVQGSSWDGQQVAPTLTRNNACGAQRMPDYDFAIDKELAPPQLAQGPRAVCESYQNVTETVCATIGKGTSNQIANDDLLVASSTISVVRRLTPKECERLQGFPDDWTNIGDWTDSKGKLHKGDSDSPRYRALGNSIALPFWRWLSRRIEARLKLEGYKDLSMASLFDGIGGFPLVFSECGIKPVWASEIEEFPIAVTKVHFPERSETK